jgi:hypothetical protein
MTQEKPAMLLKWADEQNANPIARDDAAQIIRKNRRRQARELRVRVFRKWGDTYIASEFLGVGCVIYRAPIA